MEGGAVSKTYKSPAGKLLSFFTDSRDDWKKKALERAYSIKLLNNRIKALEESREKWKEKAQSRGTMVRSLRKELEDQKSRIGSWTASGPCPREGARDRSAAQASV